MKCSFNCGSTELDKQTCQCYNDYMAEAEQRFYSLNAAKPFVSGALPPDDTLTESEYKESDAAFYENYGQRQ